MTYRFTSPPEQTTWQQTVHGVPLRDWLAGQALVAMGTWMPPADYGPFNWDSPEEVCALKARWAYAQADAMLAAREKSYGVSD